MRRPSLGALRPVFWVVAVLVLGAATLVTLTRLLEPHLGLTIQIQAFTPLAIPGYALALVLLVAYAVVFRLRRRSARTVAWPLALLALAGLVLHGWWFAPQLTGESPAADDDSERVTVLSVNMLLGRADANQVVEQVREYGVDILAVSEITVRSLHRLEAAGVAEALPHRAGRPGVEWSHDGTMVFTREPLALDAVLDTEMDSMRLTVGDLSVLAVHPSPPVFPDRWRDDHAVVREEAFEHRPDLILGDFNATLDHGPMRALQDEGYRDAIELTNAGFEPTWPNLRAPGLLGAAGVLGPVAQIDHVLVSEGFTVLETSTRDLAGSDHRMVLATVAERAD